MRPDYAALRAGEQSFAAAATDLTNDDLVRLTNEMVDEIERLIGEAHNADVVFQPDDPEADDPGAAPDEREVGWTLGHVVVHTTAGAEEGAAVALTLARGAPADGRPRYETSWWEIRTVEDVRQRLDESRRMRLAMLAGWPDTPDLANTVTPIERLGPMNAVGRYLLGLSHEDWHLPQIADVMRQARAARFR